MKISAQTVGFMSKNPDMKKRRSGEGMVYIHNKTLNKRKRIQKGDTIPEGWESGMGPRKVS